MSSLIIDGYNLIGTHHRDLEAQREKLIELLIEYKKKKGHTIVLVFDGWKSGKGGEVSSMKGGVNVIYSGLGERADSVIRRMISAERREWIVVSSDREIAGHAWATDSIPVPSQTFLRFLERGGVSPDLLSSDEEGGESEEEGRRKGNPRQLSRKEKAMQRALRKL